MEYINISRKEDYQCIIHHFSSEYNETLTVKNILRDAGYWCSRKSAENIKEYFIIDFQKEVTIDYIELLSSENGVNTFPKDFRIEASLNDSIWKVIQSERNLELESDTYRIDIPLIKLRYLKFFISEHNIINDKYFSEIGQFKAGISGIKEITASSTQADDMNPENLITPENGKYWQSKIQSNITKESLLIDLGKIFQVNRIIMGSSTQGFPENIYVETSPDNEIWTPLFDDKNFIAEANTQYYWDIDITSAQFIRIEVKSSEVDGNRYGVQLSYLEISAAPFNHFHTHNVGDLTPYASIFQAGIVKLAKDGDDTPGLVIQSSDRRLKDASTLFKGIVQLAEDRDDSTGLAVQASDTRLKPATDLTPGIVRLAYDRENKAGSAVQGNDSRLQEASENQFGIVKICPDGKYNEQSVLTGNDSRIQKATDASYGICRLAKNGENKGGTVVQADDNRLREATSLYKGIVELAEDGEDAPDVAVQGNDKRLKDATTTAKGIVELAENGEDAPDVAVQGNDKRLKDATTTTKGIVELAEDGEDIPNVAVQGNDKRLKDATTTTKGIVELAENGEDAPDVAVQGNDKRLKDATTTTKGIVELAEDGEDAPDVAVQGNDKRLKDATTMAKGIVELAEDGEDAPNVAVQGNDKRLKDTTTQSKGIVELAEDGEDAPNVAVQGNDKRLKDATTQSKGIVELAEDGEDAPDVAVQGNDKRLKDATTMAKGIVELAEDGEDASNVAVQGNDKRLKDATTQSKGIVELAEDGENAPDVAVQGNDRRLKNATTKSPGIVRLADNNESRPEFAVQSNDDRLSDKREPLAHTHEYAPLNHDFNSHTGTICIKGNKNEALNEITPPSDDSSIIHANNISDKSGSIGISGVAGLITEESIQSYGVVGHSRHVGIRGQSSGSDKNKGCGVLGISRFGAGGIFASEQSYSLVADGFGRIKDFDNSINLLGNGDALFVNGNSKFNGKIEISNTNAEEQSEYPLNYAEIFEVDEVEYISPGDLLIISNEGDSVLSRSRTEYNRSVVGIVAGNPAVMINNSGKEKKIYPVALIGKSLCKVDARNNPINPGDLIVTSSTPGCGMKGKIDSFEKIGTVIGKALGSLNEGIGIIPIFICHQ